MSLVVHLYYIKPPYHLWCVFLLTPCQPGPVNQLVKSPVYLGWGIVAESYCQNMKVKKNFFWISIPNTISVSGSLSHIMKLWVNLKSAILRGNAVIPNAIIGDLYAMLPYNMVVVICIGVLKLLSINWYVEYMMKAMAAPESKLKV